MFQKFNWHHKKYRDKQRDLKKHPPRFLYSQKKPLNNHYQQLKNQLNTEYHWYDGMRQESNGRNKLRHQIKRAINAYNDVLKYDNSDEHIALTGGELVVPYVCDCENCIECFGEPIVIDEMFLTNIKAIEAVYDADYIDLKQNFERWEYKY